MVVAILWDYNVHGRRGQSVLIGKASYQSKNNIYKDLAHFLHTVFLNCLVIYAYTRFDIHAT